MAVIHISEAEASPDIRALIERIREGDVVRIGSGLESFEVVLLPLSTKPRLIGDVIAALEQRGTSTTGDPGFADDVEDGIRTHHTEARFDPWA